MTLSSARGNPSIIVETMPCEEREQLFELLLEATKAHNDAARAMPDRAGEALERLTAVAESARKTCEDCYEVLHAHERSHGCAPNSVSLGRANV
jgi:hypothetical protein